MATTAAILDFRSERFYLFLIYKSPRYFLPNFKLIGLSVQEKKGKIYFQDGRQSWISDRNDLAILDLQVTPMLSTKFQDNWPVRSGEEAKTRFSR